MVMKRFPGIWGILGMKLKVKHSLLLSFCNKCQRLACADVEISVV